MANKVYLLPTTDTPQGDDIIRLVSHNPSVIGNRAKWSECPFSFLVQLISISNFGYLPNKHLRRKVKRSLVRMIGAMVQLKIIENLLLPRHIRYGITNSISFLHRFEKQVSLFVSWQKFYFQSEFHEAKIQNNFTYQKIITNFVKQFKALQSHSSHPRQKAMSVFPAPIL